jgi:3-methyladenine DNA glycosylase AlkD
MPAGSRSIDELRRELARAGNPARVVGMQAYLKTTEAFHGCSAGEMRAVCKKVFARWPIDDAATWRRDVLGLWRAARFREERYAAIELASDRRAKKFQTMDALPMYEEMITAGAWWDLVDGVAANLVGAIVVAEPKPAKRAMLAWSKSSDMWKRRTSIICQLRRKTDIDLDLLYACIEPSIDSKEFFLRKAIGWALREHAWTDPDEVVRYVRANESRLAGLSIREALKNVKVTSKRGTRSGRRARRPGSS